MVTRITLLSVCLLAIVVSLSGAKTDPPSDDAQWVVYQGGKGPGAGKHIVLVAGDEEYRSEECLPQLGKILAKRHGFKCTVLFSITDGFIDPDNQKNIPGLEALKTADLMIIATRFRDLPDEQMKHVADYIDAGKPVIGMRAGLVAFWLKSSKTYERFCWKGKVWKGGFGRKILGQTWMGHHGRHGRQSTRGVLIPEAKDHPIVQGCTDIWGPTDVYVAPKKLPEGSTPLFKGQVIDGMKATDKPAEGRKNNPMQYMAWTKTYKGAKGQVGRVFMTTMGDAVDVANEGLRRMLVNAAYWCVGMEKKIPAKSNVDIVGQYKPSRFGFRKFKKGVKPSDHAMK